MIQANELRIGNVVYTDFKEDNLKTVVEIKHTMASVKYVRTDTNQPHQSMVDYERIIGVPLTEEILLKCGFVENTEYEHPSFDEFIHSKNKWFGIGEFNGLYFIIQFLDQQIGTKSPKIKYVHQLQNLYFALTGEELEINL